MNHHIRGQKGKIIIDCHKEFEQVNDSYYWILQRSRAEIAAKDWFAWWGADFWPHSPRGEKGKVKDIAWHGWRSNESACYDCHEPFDHCVTGTWLLFVPTVDVGILQQWTAPSIFALLTAFHQQRNLLEFFKKRETKHSKTECCDPLADIAEHVNAVAWVRGLPVGDHVGRLLSELFVCEYFRQEENRAKHRDDAC